MARTELPPPAPRPIPPLKLGMLLVHQGAVTPVQLATALEAQQKIGHRLGQQLQELTFVSQPELLRALAAQSGAPWLPVLDPRRVRNVPSALGPNVVRALGLVPFEVETVRHRVKVACAAPGSAVGAAGADGADRLGGRSVHRGGRCAAGAVVGVQERCGSQAVVGRAGRADAVRGGDADRAGRVRRTRDTAGAREMRSISVGAC